MATVDLTDHFLIAMPSMADPNFSRTLVYVCEHNDRSALGVVINRPTDMTLATLFERVNVPLGVRTLESSPVFYGGPVQQDRGFVLHVPKGGWKSTLAVRDRLGLTTSRDILEAVGAGNGPSKVLVTLGYAGWAAGQLEHEIKQNAWLTVEARDDIIFELPPDERLGAALSSLGIDFARLQDVAGHA